MEGEGSKIVEEEGKFVVEEKEEEEEDEDEDENEDENEDEEEEEEEEEGKLISGLKRGKNVFCSCWRNH